MTRSNKPQLPRFIRSVLQSPGDAKRKAAYVFLSLIKEMSPEKTQRLYGAADRFKWVIRDSDDARTPVPDRAVNQYGAEIAKWTKDNRISSELIDNCAWDFALGNRIEYGTVVFEDEQGNIVFPPEPHRSLNVVDPYSEERDEYLNRAGEYYDQVLAFYSERTTDRLGSIKRDLTHFRWLAANRVGQFTWAEIANGDTPLNLPMASQSAIAEGGQEVARLLGIEIERKRGAKKGGRRHRRLPRITG